ncbi:MAG: TIGR00730 family Rossman fold protein [Candidatus Babeliales bacterium]
MKKICVGIGILSIGMVQADKPTWQAPEVHNPKALHGYDYVSIATSWARAMEKVISGTKELEAIDKPVVTVFGGHEVTKQSPWYKKAYTVSQKLAQQGCVMVSGGGEGIMEAVDCGAASVKNQGVTSVSINIKGLGQPNGCAQEVVMVDAFFPRKWLLMHNSSAFVVMPGGIGTIDELGQLVTLMSTNRMAKAPIYVIDTKYWKNFKRWFTVDALKAGLVSQKAVDLVTFTDDVTKVVDGIMQWIHEQEDVHAHEQAFALKTEMIGGD